jgi:hypothetical protein
VAADQPHESDGAGRHRPAPLQLLLATLAAAAAAIHFGVLGEHYAAYAPAGLFFAVVGLAQGLWAGLLLLERSRTVLAGGVILNIGVIAVWAVSRTSGLPLVPAEAGFEVVGFTDSAATVLETVFVVLACLLLLRPRLSSARDPVLGSLALVATVLLVPITAAAVVAGFGHSHDSAAGPSSTRIRERALARADNRTGPGVKSLPLYAGFVEAYVERLAPGPNKVHLGFFDDGGRESRVENVQMQVSAAGYEKPRVRFRRLSPGHVVAALELESALWTFEITARTDSGASLRTRFTQRIGRRAR